MTSRERSLDRLVQQGPLRALQPQGLQVVRPRWATYRVVLPVPPVHSVKPPVRRPVHSVEVRKRSAAQPERSLARSTVVPKPRGPQPERSLVRLAQRATSLAQSAQVFPAVRQRSETLLVASQEARAYSEKLPVRWEVPRPAVQPRSVTLREPWREVQAASLAPLGD